MEGRRESASEQRKEREGVKVETYLSIASGRWTLLTKNENQFTRERPCLLRKRTGSFNLIRQTRMKIVHEGNRKVRSRIFV